MTELVLNGRRDSAAIRRTTQVEPNPVKLVLYELRSWLMGYRPSGRFRLVLQNPMTVVLCDCVPWNSSRQGRMRTLEVNGMRGEYPACVQFQESVNVSQSSKMGSSMLLYAVNQLPHELQAKTGKVYVLSIARHVEFLTAIGQPDRLIPPQARRQASRH